MKKQILLALLFTFTYLGLNAQCNDPFPPSTTCVGAPIICSLDGYCTTTTTQNGGDNPNTFCGSVQNNQWFAFVAGTTNITLEFIVDACAGTGQGTGLQAHVYSACGAPWPSASNCIQQIMPFNTGVLTMNNLTVGNVYYLMTDGWSGDICDYTIEVAAGNTTPPVPDPAGTIVGNLAPCPGASSVTYTVPPSFGAGFYEWTIPSGATIVGADDGETITIDFGNSTGGQICVTPTNGCEDGAQSCITVSQGPAPVGPPVQSPNLCPGETFTYLNTTYSSAGTFTNLDEVNAEGCTVETQVTVVVGQDVVTNLPPMFQCQGDPPVVVGGQSFSTTTMTSVLLQTSLGCDSTVFLDLTVMNPMSGIFPPTDIITCNVPTIDVEAVVTNTDPSITYAWSGPCVGGPNGPILTAGCAGTYTLVVTQVLGGVACSTPLFSTQVNDDIVEPIADPGLNQSVGCGAAITLGGPNTSSGGGIAYAYSWVGPNGYSSSDQNPNDVTEPGQYCFFVFNLNNGCISATNCVTIDGDNTPPAAVATSSNDIDCANGSSTLGTMGSATGASITYTWTGPNGFNSNDANPSVNQTGTYTLTVTNSTSGCVATTTVMVDGDTTAPMAVIDPAADVDCTNTTVSINGANSTGGTLSYNWSDGATSSTTSVGAGTYTLTVTNTANGCTDVTSVTVNNNQATISADIQVQGELTCTNGTVTATANNLSGTTNPTYTWLLDGVLVGNTASIPITSSGTLTLVVSDTGNGCDSPVFSEIINQNTTMPVAMADKSGDIDCINTSVVLSTAGSTTANTTAVWTLNGSPVADPNNITGQGTYVLVITDNTSGCTAEAQVVVNEDMNPPSALIAPSASIDCNNMTATLDASGSMGGTLSYNWSDGTSNSSTSTMSAGTYTVTVTNTTNGCTATAEQTVDDNSTQVSVQASASGEITCLNGTATITVGTVTGINNPSYSWSNGGTGMSIDVMTAGTYTLTVQDINTGCQNSVQVTVDESIDNPSVSVLPPSNLTCNVSSINIDGSASATGNNITYQWFESGILITGATTSIIPVTTSGNYTLVVTNNDNGCSTESTIQNVVLDDAQPSVTAVPTDNGVLICGANSLTIDGGSNSNVTYQWSDANGTNLGTTPSIDVSNAGDYILVVTSIDNGCTNETFTTIIPDTQVPNASIAQSNNIDCLNPNATLVGNGTSNTGGTVTVGWVDDMGNPLSTTDTYSTNTPGTYFFVVLDDGNGCSASTQVQVDDNVDNPTSDAGDMQTLDCNNGMVTLNGSMSSVGGDITYQWLDPNDIAVGGGNTPTITTSIPGEYTLVVTNGANGCTMESTVMVEENIEAPVFLATTLNDINCNTGTATLDGTVTSSFSTNLEYLWTLNGIPVGTPDLSITTTFEGEYILEVTDLDNGCTAEMSTTVVQDLAAPDVMVDASDNGIINCDVSSVTLDGAGSSTTDVSYSWTLDGTEVSQDLTYSASAEGNYILVVTNTINGCTNEMNILVTEDTAAPDAFAGASTNLLTCTAPNATLDGSGSSIGADFSYQWVEVSTGTPAPVGDMINITIGVEGTYELIVTNNANGCTAVSSQVVVDQSSDVPVANIGNNGMITCTQSDVILDGSGSTATGMVEYLWTDPSGGNAGTTADIMASTPGEYQLQITDLGNGCTSVASFIVEEDILSPDVNVGNQSVVIDCNQSTFDLDGSTSTLDPAITYTFEWTLAGANVGNDLMIPNLTDEGTYVLEITNTENGCTATSQVVVDANFEAPGADAGNNFTITCDVATAALNGSTTSTSTNLSYVWVNLAGDTISTVLTDVTSVPDTYTLIITNNDNGCESQSMPIVVDINATLPDIDLAPAPTITCFNNSEVTLDGSLSASGAGITYQWSLDGVEIMGATSAFLTTTDPGDYTFVVSDAGTGCSAQMIQTVNDNLASPMADGGTGGTLVCGQTDFPLDGSASSATDVTYAWWTVDANGDLVTQVGDQVTFDAGSADDYVIVVTDVNNGCSSTSTIVTVDQDVNVPVIDFSPIQTLTCDLQSITIDASTSTANVGNIEYVWTNDAGMVLGTDATLDIAAPGVITLTLTDDVNNCVASTPITIPQNIMPPISNAGVGQTLLCGQDNVTLDGGGSATGSGISYSWLNPGGIEVGTDITVLATEAGEYTLIVTNSDNGCTAESFVMVDQDVQIPTADVDFTGLLTCNVDDIMVDGTPSSTVSGNIAYSWSNGSTSSTTNFDAPGTYTLTVTDLSNNCEATTSFTIDENTVAPTPDVALINGTSNILSCTQTSLVFNGEGSVANFGTDVEYIWTLDGMPISIDSEIEVTQDGVLELTVTDIANGCSATISETITTDDTLPNAVIATPNSLTCIIDEVTLDGAGSSTGADIEYLWTGPGTIVNETTLTPTISTPGTYTLTVLDLASGCDASTTMIVGSDINPPAAAANSPTSFDCVTSEITLDGNGSAAGPNISYEWTTTAGTILSGANTFTPVISAPGAYTLTVTNNANGCTAESTVNVSANNDVPVINDFLVIDPNCFGETNGSILLDDVSGGQLPYLYSFDGGAFAPVNQFGFLGAGEYEVIVQDANGCESTAQIVIDNPSELLVELGDNITIGLGDTIDLAPQIVGAYDSIRWSNCLDVCNTPILEIGPINTSQYSITLIDGNGCIATDDITVNVEKEREVFIPNVFSPNDDGLNDRFWVFAGQEAQIVHEFRVFNRWGEEVFSSFEFDPKEQTDTNGWDGRFKTREMNPQVFVYYVDIEYIDGRREVLKGDVALRR